MPDTGGLTDRAYRGADDLRLMQERLIKDFASSQMRAGDLAWAAREATHFELSLFVHLVFVDGDLAGWTWVWRRGLVDVYLSPEQRDAGVYDRMVTGAEATVAAMAQAGDHLSECRTWIDADDDVLAAVLGRRGFTASGPALQVNRRRLDDIPSAVGLPPGWSAEAVDTDERVASRVECHRAAFAPSTLTVEKYGRVRRTWPYRQELDRVIVDESGAVVASCTAWLDEANGEGLFEPVATRPADQRRGFGRAVCIDALHHLRAAGARTAQVGCIADSPACVTYQTIGFEPVTRLPNYGKAL